MTETAKAYHSITIGDKNTWDDWHLIPTSRPVFAPPEVKSKWVDIPGANGELNLTDVLTSYPVYKNRQGEFEFYLPPDDGYAWDIVYSEMMNYFHGKGMKAILADDPTFYYEGRFSVDEWKSEKSWSTIVISYNVYPYKNEINSSLDQWEWNSFDFRTGVIRYAAGIEVSGTKTVIVPGSAMRVIPTFKLTGDEDMTITFKEKTYTLKTGTHKILGIEFSNGDNELTFTGNGTVDINYRGGRL